MKVINLRDTKVEFNDLVKMAQEEPILLLTDGGGEFILSHADDFEQEVEALRKSPSFQSFLEERSKNSVRIPLSEIEKEIDEELGASS